MSVIVFKDVVIGPFKSIEVLSDRLRCDGVTDYPFTVIGNYTISEDDTLIPAPPEPAPVVPQSVTPRQIRQALNAMGLRASVEAAVAAGGQDLKDWWEFSTEVLRTHSTVLGVGQAIGKTPAELDALFTLAGSL